MLRTCSIVLFCFVLSFGLVLWQKLVLWQFLIYGVSTSTITLRYILLIVTPYKPIVMKGKNPHLFVHVFRSVFAVKRPSKRACFVLYTSAICATENNADQINAEKPAELVTSQGSLCHANTMVIRVKVYHKGKISEFMQLQWRLYHVSLVIKQLRCILVLPFGIREQRQMWSCNGVVLSKAVLANYPFQRTYQIRYGLGFKL